ncbi:hypothetical protein LLG96_15570, partial [bacterium]|nr:hypothetical protein [bacterium]
MGLKNQKLQRVLLHKKSHRGFFGGEQGEAVPASTHSLRTLFLGVTSFACPKEVTKERAPREKPF